MAGAYQVIDFMQSFSANFSHDHSCHLWPGRGRDRGRRYGAEVLAMRRAEPCAGGARAAPARDAPPTRVRAARRLRRMACGLSHPVRFPVKVEFHWQRVINNLASSRNVGMHT